MWQARNRVSGGGLASREDGFEKPGSYVEVDSIEDSLKLVTSGGGTVSSPIRTGNPHRPVPGCHRRLSRLSGC